MENQILICENCGKEHDGSYCSRRFCCKECARSFSTKANRKEINEKVSKSLCTFYYLKNGEKIKRFCKDCGKEIILRNKSGYCANCLPKHIKEFPERIENLKNSIRKSIEAGKHKGWMSRNIKSFPEKFFESVLQNNNIDYEMNKYFKRKFLDFEIIIDNLRKVDLEIDGRQHDDRIEEDVERDKFLSENGYIIYRIKWNEINSESGKKLMKIKIDSFLNFLNTL